MDKIEEYKEILRKENYIASDKIAKMIYLYDKSGEKKEGSCEILLLEGIAGGGKTSLAEKFAKIKGAETHFIQCVKDMGKEEFQMDINMKAAIQKDAENIIDEGILLKALNDSKEKPVVLIVDELDKAPVSIDSFLLDYSENGRLTTGTHTYTKGENPIYIIITSNSERKLNENLINRARRLEIPRPEKSLFLEILGLPKDHYLGYVYNKCPDFSIRQAKKYIEDLEELGVEFDEEILSQFIEFDKLEVNSLEDLKEIEDVPEQDIETGEILDFLNLDIMDVNIKEIDNEGIKNIEKTNKEVYASNWNGEMHVKLKTFQDIKDLELHLSASAKKNLKGWIEFPKEVIEKKDILWAREDSRGKNIGLIYNMQEEDNYYDEDDSDKTNRRKKIIKYQGRYFVNIESLEKILEFCNKEPKVDIERE